MQGTPPGVASENGDRLARAVHRARQVRREPPSHGPQQRRIVILVVLAVVLGVTYVVSLLAYRTSLDGSFTPPAVASDQVAVVLVPTAVDGGTQAVTAQVLLFPGSDFLADDALTQEFLVTVTPTVDGGIIEFPAGQAPSPRSVQLPTPGVIERYPFDTYQMRTRVAVDALAMSGGGDTPVRVTSSVFFDAPGWTYAPAAQSGEVVERSAGKVARSGPSILIACIFITLILAFGVMAALLLAAILRGRYQPEIAAASWLSAAMFALISLRNSLPGAPPLGSWMDVLVYFWVIVLVMIATVTTLGIVLSRAAARYRLDTSRGHHPAPSDGEEAARSDD